MNTALPLSHRPASGFGRLASMAFMGDGGRAGAVAIEAALIIPVFVGLLIALVEIIMMFVTGIILEGAAADAARQIRTGEAQGSPDPLATFQTRLCDSLFRLVDCGDLVFDVRNFGGFTTIVVEPVPDEEGNLADPGFSLGDSGEVVIVRMSYRWNFATPCVGYLVSDNDTNSRLLLSTAVFRNEPFRFGEQ
ncbi:MAG: pilus assembly protein [Alphaproteobacteria bacterium]|nr:pilus assembly protein [Alphaproteobacteria bacterium]